MTSTIFTPDDLYNLDGETFLRSRNGCIETGDWTLSRTDVAFQKRRSAGNRRASLPLVSSRSRLVEVEVDLADFRAVRSRHRMEAGL